MFKNYYKTIKNIFCQVRVRIAPSPTGPLHIGTARTALFNYLFAKNQKGKFILRIEDTDLERSDPKYEKDIIEGLKWLGLNWDEGPIRQSQRIETYGKYIQKLLDKDKAYFCPCSEEELEKERQEQITKKQVPKHICPYRNKKLNKGIIRFKTPEKGEIEFDDLIRGKLKFDLNLLGDFSIAKGINVPLYNLAVVIDDYEMKISHIIRGEDHISNTPKQILIQEALNIPRPKYAHLPLILGPDKSKLSKRHGAVSINIYRQQGYLPEAMINFMVLLGWNPGTDQEIFSLKELERIFSLDKIGKSGAVFNIEKLDWLNGYYIRQMKIDDLTKLCLPYLPPNDFYYLKKIVALEQERIKKLSEITEKTEYFFTDKLDYEPELLRWKNMNDQEIKNALEQLEKKLLEIKEKDFVQNKLKNILIPLAEKLGDKGKLLWPLRVALTGLKASPGPFEIMEILGKEKTLQRIKYAQNKIQK